MKLVAKKPCRFGGKQYFIGQEVPAEAIVSPEKFIDNGTLEVSTSSKMETVEEAEELVEGSEDLVNDLVEEEAEEVPEEAPKKTSKRKKSGDAE